jgi:hypothetical protein
MYVLNEMPSVEFNPDSVKAYLTACITKWRGYRAKTIEPPGHSFNFEEKCKGVEYYCEIAPYYVDAFQSVYASLFGATLP